MFLTYLYWFSLILIVNYEALDNSPGCEDGMDITEEECPLAAKASLQSITQSFTGGLQVGTWGHAPPGCFVGHPSDNWMHTYYNKISRGTLGNTLYKSICMKNKGGILSAISHFYQCFLYF